MGEVWLDGFGNSSRAKFVDQNGEELYLPAGLTMDKLLEIGEEVFLRRQESGLEGLNSASSAAIGMAQRLASLVHLSHCDLVFGNQLEITICLRILY